MMSPVQPIWLLIWVASTVLSFGAISAAAAGASFPQDIFSRPAFALQLGDLPGAAELPVRNHTAVSILQQQRKGLASNLEQPSSEPSGQDPSSALEVPQRSLLPDQRATAPLPPLYWVLHRSGPSSAHLCAISDFTAPDPSLSALSLNAIDNTTSSLPRQALVARALQLLEPLKQKCLFHTIDWFTYSFCHGKDVRQFRALTPASAADVANKRAGGGAEGKKAALKAATEAAKNKVPVADPQYDAFTLGRWKPHNDRIVTSPGENREPPTKKGTTTSQQPASKTSKNSVSTAVGTSSGVGTELIEVVQFGDWDEEELHAEEAQVLSRLSSSAGTGAARPGANLNRQRYVSQTWSDGTLCDISGQPRTIEVQFHCGSRGGLEDQIVVLKETTICNYVIVVETLRLCSEPAFRGGKEDKTHSIRCHKVVRDDWVGPALGDRHDGESESEADGSAKGRALSNDAAPKSPAPASSREQGAERRPRDAKVGAPAVQARGAGSSRGAASMEGSNSHTYGDLSHYNSVHDDFYDEALGEHGDPHRHLKKNTALRPDAAYRDIYGHDDDFDDLDELDDPEDVPEDDDAEDDTYLYIALDQDGRPYVDILSKEEAAEEQARVLAAEDEEDADAAEEVRDGEKGPTDPKDGTKRRKRKNRSVDIDLDLDAILGSAPSDGENQRDGHAGVNGPDDRFEKALAKSIEDKLNQARDTVKKLDHGGNDKNGESAKDQNRDKDVPTEGKDVFVDLYQELMEALRGDPLNQPDQTEGEYMDDETEQGSMQPVGPKAADGDAVEQAVRKAAGARGSAFGSGRSDEQPANFPRNGRMEKVGDSLGERAKRFYDAEDRKRQKRQETGRRDGTVRVEL